MNKNTLLSLLFFLAIAGTNTASAIEITFGPYLQQVGPEEAVIIWGTDKKALSWVETAPDDSLHFYAEERPKFFQTHLGRKVLGTLHRVKVDNLKSGTTYRYRIFSQEVLSENSYQINYGPVASTRVYKKEPLRFTTTDRQKTAVKFRVVNDMHADTAKMAKLLGDVRHDNTDFVIYNGDMVSFMDTEQQIVDGFIDKSVQLFASETPFYMVRGNHEGRGVFAGRYPDYFPTSTGMPYYTFSQGPVFFIVMDGGEDKPDNDIEYFNLNQMDRYREDEAQWLRQVVASDEFKRAKYKVVMVHVPPLGDTWHGPLHAKKLFLPILNSAGIDLMLCAHLHTHLFIAAEEQEAQFPILINSNVDAIHATADSQSLEISVRNLKGTEIQHLSIQAK